MLSTRKFRHPTWPTQILHAILAYEMGFPCSFALCLAVHSYLHFILGPWGVTHGGLRIKFCVVQVWAEYPGEGELCYNGEDHWLHPPGQGTHKDWCRVLQGDHLKWGPHCNKFSPPQIQKQAEANRLLLTPEFLELKKIEAISTNNKVLSWRIS